MSSKVCFEVRVKGEGFALEEIRLKEVTELLVAIENMLVAIVERDHPALNISKSGALGLTSLQSGSLHAGFESPHEEVVQAWYEVSHSIETRDYSGLPPKVTDELGKIEKFNRRHDTDAEFWLNNGSRQHLATITADAGLPESLFVYGTTTLYGKLLRIGGDSRPTASLDISADKPLNCRVKTIELASSMAHRLYDVIGVRGTAKWSIAEYKPVAFTVEQLTEYRQTSLTEAFDSLSEVAAKHYADLEDVNAFVADLRGRGPEDE